MNAAPPFLTEIRHKPDSIAESPASPSGAALLTGLVLIDRYGRLLEPHRLRGEHWNDVFGADSWPLKPPDTDLTRTRVNHHRQSQWDPRLALIDREQWLDLAPDMRRCVRVRLFCRNDHYVAWIDDVTERKHAERRLRYAAEHDSLSGLLNRRGFHTRLEQTLARIESSSSFLIYMDLDEFKRINDFFGHAAGDQVLRQIAMRIRHQIRTQDAAARLGGDEFALLMQDCDENWILSLATRLRQALRERPYAWQGHAFHVGVSVGVIRLNISMSPADALAAADAACQFAKQAAPDAPVTLTETQKLLAGVRRELDLAKRWRDPDFERALSCDMQTIISLDGSGAPAGFECLLRIRDESGLTHLPAQFLPVARQHGLMTRFDGWMLDSTLDWLDSHLDQLPWLRFCSINVSGASLNDQRFLDRICASAERFPKAIGKLCFEIADGADGMRGGQPRRFVTQCRALGARVALDDFGAPRRALPNLRDLPVDLVKLSPQLGANALRDSHRMGLLKSLSGLAHALEIRSVACGVDDRRLLQPLAEVGVDYAQGFALAQPTPREVLLPA